eukprot:2120099-Prymnesium_polylepis.1
MGRAPSDGDSNGTGKNAAPSNDSTVAGDTGAVSTHPMPMPSLQAAGSSSGRHEPHPARGAAPVSTQVECFSVPELRERAVQ